MAKSWRHAWPARAHPRCSRRRTVCERSEPTPARWPIDTPSHHGPEVLAKRYMQGRDSAVPFGWFGKPKIGGEPRESVREGGRGGACSSP